MAIPSQYQVEPPRMPGDDRSGDIGQRLLKLLSDQVERTLRIVEQDRQRLGTTDEDVFDTESVYFLHYIGGSAYALAALAQCGVPGETMTEWATSC